LYTRYILLLGEDSVNPCGTSREVSVIEKQYLIESDDHNGVKISDKFHSGRYKEDT
jgi:hypothetical protein